MKPKIYLSLLLAACCFLNGFSQESKTAETCKPYLDSMRTEMTIEDALKWADSAPIRVSCDDGKIYTLLKFDISIFTKKPLQTREFGTGEKGGIPILAYKAIENGKPGDTVILKNTVYLDAERKEQKLPVISFVLK